MTNVEAIPTDLQSVPQWVCWTERERGGKQTKVPLWPETQSFASVRDSGTWTSFNEAVETASAEDSVAGIGFVFTEGDPFVGVDLDDCRDPETGDPEPWASEIIDQLDSFSEVSPSGTGYHVYVRGDLPDGGNRSGNIECYEAARFFTVTGKRVPGTPMAINERSEALADVHATHIAQPEMETGRTDPDPASATTSMDDEEVLSRAMNAKNGPKFTRLWNGNTSGYDSQSEADMALCCLLAFWTQKDAAQMDRLFRQSSLYRGKWDDQHYSGGKTYGEGTVERAIAVTSDVFEPSEREAANPPEAMDRSSERSAAKHRPGAETRVDANQSVMRVHDEVAALEATVAELRQANVSLEAQHEHLYEVFEAERNKREQLAKRVETLEALVAEESESWLSRVFG